MRRNVKDGGSSCPPISMLHHLDGMSPISDQKYLKPIGISLGAGKLPFK